jgi:MFS family permease
MAGSRIITRTILLVSLVSLFTDIASEMLYPVMPIYLESVGFSVILIGLLEGIAEATAGLSKGYFGNLSDLTGKRVPFIRLGYGLSAVSKPLFAAWTFPVWIFFVRTLDRLGKGVRTSARDALLSDEATPATKGRVFGFHRSMDTVGAAIGPILALIYLWYFPGHYTWLFLIAFLPGLFAIFLTLPVKDKKTVAKKTSLNKVGFLHFLRYWKIANNEYKMLVIGLLMFTFFNSSDILLLLLVKTQGTSDTGVIGFYIFYNLVYALFSYPAGMLADRLGLRTVLIAGLIMFTFVYASISFTNNFWLLGVLFFCYGLYASSTEGIAKALISNISQRENTATAIGFFNSFSSIFALLASSFTGFIWFAAGSHFAFLFSAGGTALVAIYLVVIFTRKRIVSV